VLGREHERHAFPAAGSLFFPLETLRKRTEKRGLVRLLDATNNALAAQPCPVQNKMLLKE
jgi:hypothetical protein